MPKQSPFINAILCVLLATAAVPAATVTFDILPAEGNAGQEIVVAPGAQVAYEITALVTSDDPETIDNGGLAFFRVDIETDLGVAQAPADEFDAAIAAAFTLLDTLGQSSDDDVIEIGGAQDTLLGSGTLTADIAVDHVQVLARGQLATPADEGTFSVMIAADPRANVFTPGSTSDIVAANTATGTGFTIRTQVAATDDTGLQDGSGTDTGNVDNTGESNSTSQTTETPVLNATLAAIGVAALVAGAFLLFGPLISAVVLVVALVLLVVLAAAGS